MLAVWLLAQAAPDDAINIGQAIVSYGIAAPFVGWLIWQLRSDRKAYNDDRAAFAAEIAAEGQANRELYDRIITQQERMAPILEQAARALDHAVERR